jgi:hypothetical protein
LRVADYPALASMCAVAGPRLAPSQAGQMRLQPSRTRPKGAAACKAGQRTVQDAPGGFPDTRGAGAAAHTPGAPKLLVVDLQHRRPVLPMRENQCAHDFPARPGTGARGVAAAAAAAQGMAAGAGLAGAAARVDWSMPTGPGTGAQGGAAAATRSVPRAMGIGGLPAGAAAGGLPARLSQGARLPTGVPLRSTAVQAAEHARRAPAAAGARCMAPPRPRLQCRCAEAHGRRGHRTAAGAAGGSARARLRRRRRMGIGLPRPSSAKRAGGAPATGSMAVHQARHAAAAPLCLAALCLTPRRKLEQDYITFFKHIYK